jgi:hypothetical protein
MMHIMVYKLDGVVQGQNRPRNKQRKSDILNGYTYGEKKSLKYMQTDTTGTVD